MSFLKIILKQGLPFFVVGINNRNTSKIKKITTMKKFFAIIAIASFAVACNNEATKTDVNLDSAANKIENTVDAAKDSMNKMVDSTAAKLDSTAQAVIDTIKK